MSQNRFQRLGALILGGVAGRLFTCCTSIDEPDVRRRDHESR
jgi:hypothetical protein